MYHVKDIMCDRPIAVRPETTIDEAIELLVDNRVSGLPVVDGQGLLVGVISEVDIINLVYKADIEGSVVGDYMSRVTQSLEAEASLDDAASIFCGKNIRRIPIVSDGKLVGIVSRRDLIRFIRSIRKNAPVM
ncbi:MAG: CBS domain-containing protein [Planctomycetia bacterium]|jgi:CBS domain-containing protein|nr:CBS domain-containing protein [Planctomycetia bacterium]